MIYGLEHLKHIFKKEKGMTRIESFKLNLYYIIILNTGFKYISYNSYMELVNKWYENLYLNKPLKQKGAKHEQRR
jgi:hypothetical protein